jgi:hypothetical protein
MPGTLPPALSQETPSQQYRPRYTPEPPSSLWGTTQSTEEPDTWADLGSGHRERTNSIISTTTTTTKYLEKLDASLEDSALEDRILDGIRDLTIDSSRNELADNGVIRPREQEYYYPTRFKETGLGALEAFAAHRRTNALETENWFKNEDAVVEESMLSVLNGIKHSGGIKMCMDGAGRWRIAWGQLQDGTRSRHARF